MLLVMLVVTTRAFVLPPHAPRGRSALRATPSEAQLDPVSAFCVGTNEFWKKLVVQQVREAVQTRPGGTAGAGFLERALAPPETPGIPRPVWFTIAASVPTGLVWYGYYKFSVEQEIFEWELAQEGKVTGCGGFGTLFPFVYGVIVGGPLALAHLPAGDLILELSAAWLLCGQVNLYRRVNEYFPDAPPLHAWWALLPPPFDVVVGLRQVHFLSEYWKTVRETPDSPDPIAEEWFPFISAPRFTLLEFATTPKMWFGFTRDWPDIELPAALRQDK